MFHLFGALAEFERDLIRERTLAGLAAARARGRSGGRPTVWTPEKQRTARVMHQAGEDVPSIARVLGVSRASVYRVLQRLRPRMTTRPCRLRAGRGEGLFAGTDPCRCSVTGGAEAEPANSRRRWEEQAGSALGQSPRAPRSRSAAEPCPWPGRACGRAGGRPAAWPSASGVNFGAGGSVRGSRRPPARLVG